MEEKLCQCLNCGRTTPHMVVPFMGLRCMMCYKWNKKEEYHLHEQETKKSILAYIK